MKIIVFASLLAAATSSGWSPPSNPDPQAILQSAESVSSRVAYVNVFLPQNVSESEKADATAQLVWFYENALSIDPALSGVRQSFALSAWVKLGDSYPPAREQLIATRDQRVDRVHANSGVRDAFFDAVSINRYLKDDDGTVRLFLWLDQNNRPMAQRVYSMAQPALVRAHDYALCAKYLDADKAFESARRSFGAMKNMPEPQGTTLLRAVLPDASVSSFAVKDFSNRTTTIVALLAVNGDHDRAQEISHRAEAVYDSPQLQASMQDALKGIVPEPWPPPE